MKTRIKKRSLSLLLVIAMVLTLCPINVFAAGEGDEGATSSGTALGVNYSITSDGVCTIEAVPGTDGKMENAGFSTTTPWGSNNTIKKIVIKEGVTSIGDYAFSESSASEIEIAGTVTSIGESAFEGCENLTGLVIPEGVTTIGADALADCVISGKLSLPSTLKCGEDTMFSGTSEIKSVEAATGCGYTVKDSVVYSDGGKLANFVIDRAGYEGELVIAEGTESILKNFFKNLKITKLVLPSTLTDTTNITTGTCRQLKEAVINCNLGNKEFQACTSLEKVVVNEGVTSITGDVFYYCTGLKTIALPKSLEEVEGGAFASLSAEVKFEFAEGSHFAVKDKFFVKDGKEIVFSLDSELDGELTIPEGITVIADGAFRDAAITGVKLPDSLEKIGNEAFCSCGSLTSVTFGSKKALKSIGDSAFETTGFTSIAIPEGVETIGRSAFMGCSSLTSITFPNTLKSLGNSVLGSCSRLESVEIPVSLGENALCDCIRLKTVTLKEGAEEIGDGAFSYCESLETVILPNSIKRISATAFEGCGKIPKLSFPQNYDSGEPLNVTKQPVGGTFTKNDKATATVETDAAEDAILIYNWFENGEAAYQNSNTIEVDTSTVGTKKIYCEIISIKDGKISSAKTSEVTVTVQEPIVFKGAGTEEDPYLIESTKDIETLSAKVAEGESYEGKYFKLTNNLTLPKNWAPIGCTKDGKHDIDRGKNMNAFSGIFDGAGLTVTVPAGEKPLFAYVYKATIKNLGIYGEKIEGYGLVNNYEGVGLGGTGVVIDNVTLKSGSKTLKSGLIGGVITTNSLGATSYTYSLVIKNCTIEKDVVVGYDGTESYVGSFAGRVQGTIENCVSHATVKGVNYVGGIVAMKDNAMGEMLAKNCTFDGDIIASGNCVGGILGGVYDNSTAPNAIRASIEGCTVTGNVTGKENVGGILGGDIFVAQAWNAYHITDNFFNGKVSGEKNVGAIFGYYRSLNKWDDITGNKFMEGCGSEKAFGVVEYVDTNCANPTTVEGVLYLNTETSTAGCPKVMGCSWKVKHNRADDPLGKDADKLAVLVKKEEPKDEAAEKVAELAQNIEDLMVEFEDGNPTEAEEAKLVENVVEATKAYEALTAEQKASLPEEIAVCIKNAQKKAGEINHKAGDIKVSGIDWNVKINVKLFEPASEEAKKIEEAAAKDYKNEKVLIIYDLSLTDVLTGAGTEPGANGITITLPAPEGTKDFDHVIIAHLRADGVVEYVEAEVKDGEMTFTLKSLSPVAVVGYNKGEVLNEEITSNGDTTPDAAVTTQDATLVKSPVTGDPIAAILFVYASLMILCAGAFVAALRRKAR